MNNDYYYYTSHLTNSSIKDQLEAGAEYKTFSNKIKNLLDLLVDEYPEDNYKEQEPEQYCIEFEDSYNKELKELKQLKGLYLSKFLNNYLGFKKNWGATQYLFATGSSKKAQKITEDELIQEMTDDKNSSIKKLLNATNGDLSAVKPFLPAIIISLSTNTRSRDYMKFKHTGKFCFDIDGLEDSNEARQWMNKLWTGTKNIQPYMTFISPRGKGVKVFCQVNTKSQGFQKDFILEDRETVMNHHKVWYEGARKELLNTFPELTDKFDNSTKDPQRLTYIPFISQKKINFKYDATRYSNYKTIVDSERTHKKQILNESINKNIAPIQKIMKEQNISSKEDAYYVHLKSLSHGFNLKHEKDKLINVINHLKGLSSKDPRIADWCSKNFSDYNTLHKLSWVLYGVFGDLAIEELKRLIPKRSNKLDKNHNDYRWALRTKNDYTDEQLQTLTPGAFYELVHQIDEVKKYLSKNYRLSFCNISDIKLLNDYYQNYTKNKVLEENDDDNANLQEFLDEFTKNINNKKVRLPLIQELEAISPDIKLGPSEYLNKDKMHDLFHEKYKNKSIFSLRSQCGTGKSSLASDPKFKTKGRILILQPYKSIAEQIAKVVWDGEERPDHYFVNSTIVKTINSFKKTINEPIKINYFNTLKDKTLPDSPELVIQTTFNQLLNLTERQMNSFDYIYVDESHTLIDGIDYRADITAGVIFSLVEFIAKNRTSKTKVVFMSGTPNVETHVVKEIMEMYKIGSSFQRIIIDKKYKLAPKIHLTHLDTTESVKRNDAIINQTSIYLKQGRKVCLVFNNKKRMDKYIRKIQTKLTNTIKVGVFYSGSKGDCTDNILNGKFGDYDVVLTTTYFINGINIEKDGLTEKEIKEGKTSTQKYGVILDIGSKHSKINAMEAIQVINRFRNRECYATVFFPPIFKPDSLDSSKGFDYLNAGKIMLGFNTYNYHLLSVNKNVQANLIDEKKEDYEESISLLNEVRKNPIFVSEQEIFESNKRKENERIVVSSIDKKIRIYKTWFYSIDGYYYLAKDAGFSPIIKNQLIEAPLKELTEDEVKVENELIKNFFKDKKSLNFLNTQNEDDIRIVFKSSGKILDPTSTSACNFTAVAEKNRKFTIEGDFHSSYERVINNLKYIYSHFVDWYKPDVALKLIKGLTNPKIDVFPNKASRNFDNILSYFKSCKAALNKNYLQGISYLQGLDSLSRMNLGVLKEVESTYISYTIPNPEVVKTINDNWAKQQYDLINYKLEKSSKLGAQQLKEYFSKQNLIKKTDLKNLTKQLKEISIYTPLKYKSKGVLNNYETIIIPKVMQNKNSQKPYKIEHREFSEPEKSTYNDDHRALELFSKSIYRKLKIAIPKKHRKKDLFIKEIYDTLKTYLKKKDIYQAISFIEKKQELLNNKSKHKTKELLLEFKSKLMKFDAVALSVFKTSEHETYRNITSKKPLPFIQKNFFCDGDFKLENLENYPTSLSSSMSKQDLYDVTKSFTDLYLKSRNLPNEMRPLYLVVNNKNKVINANFYLTKACDFLCDYAYKNEGFKLNNGNTPVKNFNKGIYNPSTFKRDYYSGNQKNNRVKNYRIESIDIDVSDYVNYVNSLNKKKAS